MGLCSCGCGKETLKNSSLFFKGHYNRGKKLSNEHKEKLSIAHTGICFSEEHKKNISNANLGRKFSEETINKIRNSNLGQKRSEEFKKKISELQKGKKRSPLLEDTKRKISKKMKGRILSELTKSKIKEKLIKIGSTKEFKEARSFAARKLWDDKEYRKRQTISHKGHVAWNKGCKTSEETKKKQSEVAKGRKHSKEEVEANRKRSKERWLNKEFQKMMQKAIAIKPNKLELLFDDLLQKMFPNEWKYVGDFQFFLGGKNPDFMNVNGKKKLIELYGDYWHQGEDPQDRINHFKQYGFDTLVLWESEIKNNINEVKQKLKCYAS